jgi:hypothetical protein
MKRCDMKTQIKTTILACFLFLTSMSLENCASRVVYMKKAPPARRVEVKSARPYSNAVWVAGHWKWNGRSYIWSSGRWIKPKKGKNWVPSHYEKTRRGWHFIPGHWK